MSLKRNTASGLLLVSIAAGALAFQGCGPSSKQRYEDSLVNTGKPALHAVHNDRLVELMGRLGNLYYQSWPQEIEDQQQDQQERAREKYLAEVADVAAAMSRAAGDLPDAVKDAGLTVEERTVFDNLTTKLRDGADRLGKETATGNLDSIQSCLDQLSTTCNACHSKFREFPALR